MRADETVDIRSQEPRNAKETERGVGANEHYDNGCGNEPPSETAREHDLDLTSLTLFRSMITQQFRQPLSRERGAQLTAVAQRPLAPLSSQCILERRGQRLQEERCFRHDEGLHTVPVEGLLDHGTNCGDQRPAERALDLLD